MRGGQCGDDPEPVGMLDEGDSVHFGRSDVPTLSKEADLRGLLDSSGMMDGEVEVEDCRSGAGHQLPCPRRCSSPPLGWASCRWCGTHGGRGARRSGREQFVGLLAVADTFHAEKSGKALLPEAEAELDLALGLGIGGDEVAHAGAAEGALELGEGVGVSGLGRFMAEEAQPAGIEDVGQAEVEEDRPDMGEVGEGDLRLDEAGANHAAGGVINGHGEDLEVLAGPPLVRRVVALEEVAVALALPPAVGFGVAPKWFAQQLREVFASMAADVGGGAAEPEAPGKLIGEEGEVGLLAVGQRGAQECDGLRRPWSTVVASGSLERQTAPVGQPAGPQLVEPRTADAETGASVIRAQRGVVEGHKGGLAGIGGQAVEELHLFVPPIHGRDGGTGEPRQHKLSTGQKFRFCSL